MFVGILQFELFVHGSESLKDKRRVFKSVKDRLHRDHMVAVAEVGALDQLNFGVLGLAMVGLSNRQINQTFDRIVGKLRKRTDAELGATQRQILKGADAQPGDLGEPWDADEAGLPTDAGDDEIEEMLR
jgi:uncharacterized protein YlxP (DUF503 family)